MLLLIPLLPFLGFVVNAALGRRLPKSVSGGIACLADDRGVPGGARLRLAAPRARRSSRRAGGLQLAVVGRLAGALRAQARPALGPDDSRHHRHRVAHPHLLDRVHARGDRQRVRPLLLLPEPVRVVHARARARVELPGHVRRLGRASGSARISSSGSITRSSRRRMPARRPSSSTASATSGSSSGCSSSS